MKKFFQLFVVLSFGLSAQVAQVRHNETFKKVNGVQVLVSTTVDTVIMQPNWTGLKNDLYNSSLFSFALENAAPNAFSSLLKCISDGEQGNSTPQVFAYILGFCRLNFSQDQKDEFNAIFAKNYFALQL